MLLPLSGSGHAAVQEKAAGSRGPEEADGRLAFLFLSNPPVDGAQVFSRLLLTALFIASLIILAWTFSGKGLDLNIRHWVKHLKLVQLQPTEST